LVCRVRIACAKAIAHSPERSALRGCCCMNADQSNSRSSDHEQKDADVGSLGMIAALFLICGVIVILACMGLIHLFRVKDQPRQTRVASVASTSANFPEPRLEVTPAADLQKSRGTDETELNSYGWIDRAAGIVRIPIDRAMELIAQRGLPEVGANKTPLQLMQERPQQGETPAPTPTISQ
jgi:hypothetical protein